MLYRQQPEYLLEVERERQESETKRSLIPTKTNALKKLWVGWPIKNF